TPQFLVEAQRHRRAYPRRTALGIEQSGKALDHERLRFGRLEMHLSLSGWLFSAIGISAAEAADKQRLALTPRHLVAEQHRHLVARARAIDAPHPVARKAAAQLFLH